MLVPFIYVLLTSQLSSLYVLALVLVPRDALSDSGLLSASWIWAAPVESKAPLGNVAFMRTFSTPSGKTASAAAMTITAVNNFTVWVNGNPIGSSANGTDDWKLAHGLRAHLKPDSVNMFAILASSDGTSGAPAPGLLAAIKIEYTDGSSDNVFTDSNWAVATKIPDDFPTPSDATQFVAATALAPFGSGPWGKSVTVAPTDPTPPTLSTATWIWTTKDARTGAPAVGIDAFRKTISTVKTAKSAFIILVVDDAFSLYVNGKYVGESLNSDWSSFAQQFTVALNPASNTFSVIGQNHANGPGNPAGFLAAIKVFNADGTSQSIASDATWLSHSFPSGNYTLPSDPSIAAFLSMPDSDLVSSFALGNITVGPWEIADTFDSLNAASVPTSPFTTTTTTTDPPPSNSAPPTSGSKPLPIKAIIGGVVGGVALLGLVLGFLFWRRRRNSRSEDDEGKAPAVIDPLPPPPIPFDTEAHSGTPLLQPSYYTTPFHHPSASTDSYPPASESLISTNHFPNPHSTSSSSVQAPTPPSSRPREKGRREVGLSPTTERRHSEDEVPPPGYTN
ncbi:hypothetical protein C8J57DRAFT_1135042 [Mycena rebaudengoi]|nr:hypothetical protein C8J57DRAFT_1135042 [Mycena rebaudengoi]